MIYHVASGQNWFEGGVWGRHLDILQDTHEICKFQVVEQEGDDTTTYFESILCKAVQEAPRQKVRT